MSETIESDLKEILNKLDHKLDKLDAKFEQKFDKLDERLDKLEAKFEKRFERLDNKVDSLAKDVHDIKVSQAKLEEKADGLGKRMENQEFLSRGVIIGLILALLAGVAKIFGFVGV